MANGKIFVCACGRQFLTNKCYEQHEDNCEKVQKKKKLSSGKV